MSRLVLSACLVCVFSAAAFGDTITIEGTARLLPTSLSPPDLGASGFEPIYHENAIAVFDVPPGSYSAGADRCAR